MFEPFIVSKFAKFTSVQLCFECIFLIKASKRENCFIHENIIYTQIFFLALKNIYLFKCFISFYQRFTRLSSRLFSIYISSRIETQDSHVFPFLFRHAQFTLIHTTIIMSLWVLYASEFFRIITHLHSININKCELSANFKTFAVVF